MNSNWKERRRSNRVDLLMGEDLDVHLLVPQQGTTGETRVGHVRNISLRGCRIIFDDPSSMKGFTIGQNLVASIAVDNFAIPVTVEITRAINDREIAIHFKPPFPKELERLEKFLEPRCLGLSMREIDPSHLQEGTDKKLRWFHGINDTNLFVWIDSGRGDIVQLQLVFLDHVVEWRTGGGVRTGRVKSDGVENPKPSWVKSELMDLDVMRDKSAFDQARVLISSSRIDPEVKKAFMEKLGGL